MHYKLREAGNCEHVCPRALEKPCFFFRAENRLPANIGRHGISKHAERAVLKNAGLQHAYSERHWSQTVTKRHVHSQKQWTIKLVVVVVRVLRNDRRNLLAIFTVTENILTELLTIAVTEKLSSFLFSICNVRFMEISNYFCNNFCLKGLHFTTYVLPGCHYNHTESYIVVIALMLDCQRRASTTMTDAGTIHDMMVLLPGFSFNSINQVRESDLCIDFCSPQYRCCSWTVAILETYL